MDARLDRYTLYKQGKMEFLKLLKNNSDLQNVLEVFENPDTDSESDTNSGLPFLVSLYVFGTAVASRCASSPYYQYYYFGVISSFWTLYDYISPNLISNNTGRKVIQHALTLSIALSYGITSTAIAGTCEISCRIGVENK